jgi:AraC-like DNA-binding protein
MPGAPQSRERVQSFCRHGTLTEHYWYPEGAVGEMTLHTHAEYQICLSLDTPGEYSYLGKKHQVPPRSVTLIHPHEIHGARDMEPRSRPAEFWLFYVPVEVVRETAGSRAAPFAAQFTSIASDLVAHFSALPARLFRATNRLEHDEVLTRALGDLLGNLGLRSFERPVRSVPARLDRTHEIIREHCDQPLSLNILARAAGMSSSNFSREFRRRFGRPPHRYLVQMRVERAKRLLSDGVSIAEVATACGFADQSHLNRHFRQLTGTTAGRYFNFGRNVLER